MSDETKEIIEKISKTFAELKTANDESLKLSEKRFDGRLAEDEVKLEKINADIDMFKAELKQVIATRKIVEEMQAAMKRPVVGEVLKTNSTPEELRAFDKYLRYGQGQSARTTWDQHEIRALSSLVDGQGGWNIPVDMSTQILMKAYSVAEIRKYANVGITGRDRVHVGGLSKPTGSWGNEVEVLDQSITSGHEWIDVKDLRGRIDIPNDTLEDSAADIIGALTNGFGSLFPEMEDEGFAIGDGVKQPRGIMVDSRVLANYTVTGVAADIFDSTHNGIDVLKDMHYALNKKYRMNAVWGMNSATECDFRKVKNDNGDYLWHEPYQDKPFATFMGFPIINIEAMDDVGANLYPAFFADLSSGFWIRDRQGLTITRANELRLAFDETSIFVKKRVAGQVVMPEAFRVLKCST